MRVHMEPNRKIHPFYVVHKGGENSESVQDVSTEHNIESISERGPYHKRKRESKVVSGSKWNVVIENSRFFFFL